MTYDHTSIKILTEAQAEARFGFVKTRALAKEYNRSVEWLTRAFEACTMAGVPEQYIIDKYLDKLEIPKNEAVDYQMSVLLKQAKGK